MKSKSLQPLLLLCWALLIALPLAVADNDGWASSLIGSGDEQPITTARDHGTANGQKPIDGSSPNEPGAATFQEATRLLGKIKPSNSPLARFSKPSGFLGTTVYYAKEVFQLLFLSNQPQQNLLSESASPRRLSPILLDAVKLLEDAAKRGNLDARITLADMNFFGNYTHPRNYAAAYRRYLDIASDTGNATAQHMVGFMYATGIGGAVPQDQARAMLYHTFAAEGGDIKSEMTLGYRYHTGIATPRNCDNAVYYYKRVADKAVKVARSGPPGGSPFNKESFRIADNDGGVYGEGASVSSAGANARSPAHTDQHASPDDVMEYLDLMTRKGDYKAAFTLGRMYYDGSRTLKRDLPLAKKYFMEVARLYWTKEGKIRSEPTPGVERYAAKAAGYLGRMFLRGEGMEQSFPKAKIWFTRGISNGDPLCQYHLGLMYLDGLGVTRDPVKAAEYFGAAADQDLSSAQVKMGALFLDQGQADIALKYFDHAARNGHLEALYYLAEMNNQGIGTVRHCGMAAIYYKIVAEKAEALTADFVEANEAYENGDIETAMVDYMMAAEQGFEIAQANVAYLMDKSRPRSPLRKLLSSIRTNVSNVGDAALALIYWSRSAEQRNVDSMVRQGDYYFEGLGTQHDPEKAASCYQAAAETMLSAQAYWNLGWMHENGVGIDQDFHLAKRFYDLALETNSEAYLPVKLSLLKLRLRSWWNTVSHGKVNSIRDEPAPKTQWSLSEWIGHFLDEADQQWYGEEEADDWGPEHHMPGADDYYDDEIDSGILESLIIIGLAATLAFLVYYRQQRQAQHQQHGQGQQNQDQQQPEQGDRGLFPQPGDPEFNNWIAGGIGH